MKDDGVEGWQYRYRPRKPGVKIVHREVSSHEGQPARCDCFGGYCLRKFCVEKLVGEGLKRREGADVR